LANIETPGRRECGERHAEVGLPLFLKKLHHDGFGVHADEFLSKDAIEVVDIARMDAVAVVDHGAVAHAFAKSLD
jgi:hypothetical protein